MSRFSEHPASRFVLVPVMCALLLLTPVYDEMRPVLKSFNVTEIKWVLGGLEVWGVMEKQRKCSIEEFYAIVEFRGDRPREPRIIETPADTEGKRRLISRLTGKSAFGPWLIHVPSSAIAVDVYTAHNCWWYRLTERRMPIWRRGS